jgi:transglutaminase-like putative cysteine protease
VRRTFVRGGSKTTPRSYYMSTWRSLVLLTTLFNVRAAVTPLALVLLAGGVALAALMTHGAGKRVARFVRTFAVLTSGSLALGILVAQLRAPDTVRLIAGLALSGVPATVAFHHRARYFWLSLLAITLNATAILIVRDDFAAYAAFIGILMVLVFHLNAANLHFLAAGRKEQEEPLTIGYFWEFAWSLMKGLGAGGLIFFLFPRIHGIHSDFGLTSRGLVGYSGKISLSGGGELGESRNLALRVEAKNSAWLAGVGANLYLRGSTLETFDGREWHAGTSSGQSFEPGNDARVSRATTGGEQPLHVYLEASGSTGGTLFYPFVLRNASLGADAVTRILVRRNGDLVLERPSSDRIVYNVDVLEPTAPELMTTTPVAQLLAAIAPTSDRTPAPYELEGRDVERLRRVPGAIADAPWFRAWIAEVGVDPKRASLTTMLEALARHFRLKYTPTLANTFSGKNALESFVTADRAGHCEYFASAAAMYLRAQGVPTRVVTGYHGGTFNVFSQVLEVHDSDAHAWLEVYVPGVGWQTFDPTPFQPSAMAEDFSEFMQQAYGALAFWVTRYVIDYDLTTQGELLAAATAALTNLDARAALLAAFRLVLGLVAIALAAVLVRRRRRRLRRGTRVPELPKYYRVFARKLARLNKARRHAETFRAFHHRLLEDGFDADVVTQVDRAIAAELYGEAQVARTERRRLERLVARFAPRRPTAKPAA